MNRTAVCFSAFICLVIGVLPVQAGNWPQWRGPSGDGISKAAQLPLTWSEKSGIAWKSKLTGWGNSTPAIWGDAIFVTSQLDDGRLVLLRINTADGKVQWTRKVGVGVMNTPKKGKRRKNRGKTKFHKTNNMASPSPVTNGQVVVAHFGNGDLAAYDFAGKQLWHRNLQKDHGAYTIWWGHSNSPVIYKDLVISVCMQDACLDLPGKPAPSYLVAHDLRTGKQVWKTMRMTGANKEPCDAYTTPILRSSGEGQELVVMGGTVLDAYDPGTGKRLWYLPKLPGNRIIPSPVAAHGRIYANTAFFKDQSLLAVKVNGQGKRPHKEIVWKYQKAISDSPSPIVWGDNIFYVNNTGVAHCLNAHTGKLLWAERLRGDYRASPIAAAGRIYFLNTEGLTTVISASSTFKRLAENQVNDETFASPAIADGKIFIRGRDWLFCVGG